MSYLTDHMAWQQRVALESKASKRFFDFLINNPQHPSFAPEAVRFYQNAEQSMRDSRYSRFSVASPHMRPQSALTTNAFKNKQIYTFGGRTTGSKQKLRQLIGESSAVDAQHTPEQSHTFDGAATPARSAKRVPGTPEIREYRPYVARSVLLGNTKKPERPRSSAKPKIRAGLTAKVDRFNEELGMSSKRSAGTQSMRSFKLAKEGPRSSVQGPLRKVFDPESMNSHFKARAEGTADLRASRASHPAVVAGGVVERRDPVEQEEARKRDDIMDILAGMSNDEIERLKLKLHVLDDVPTHEEEKYEGELHAAE